MSPITVIIVDDESAGRRTLRECCAMHPDLEVIGEYGDPRIAVAAIRDKSPQLLFLDIKMDTMTGIDLARSLDPAALPQIVFVTAYDQYALEAFGVSATDYLLKPFDDERFNTTLERVRRRHGAETAADRAAALELLVARLESGVRAAATGSQRLIAEAYGRQHVLDPALIEVVEADRNYVRIRIGAETYHARSTLQQAEQLLQTQPMLKVSRSCLVSMNHVRELSRTPRGDFILVLAGGATVTSSEGFRDRVRAYLEQLKL